MLRKNAAWGSVFLVVFFWYVLGTKEGGNGGVFEERGKHVRWVDGAEAVVEEEGHLNQKAKQPGVVQEGNTVEEKRKCDTIEEECHFCVTENNECCIGMGELWVYGVLAGILYLFFLCVVFLAAEV
ncbi:MAG: uncharacterized protein A8A55_2174 [Amphiamblys sp. WSBS2006]|nr:MAG: uncharacterized protein A8A55_2174 [Amphiamblys sp. WSBS2006]